MSRIIKFYRTEKGRCPVEDFLEELDCRTLAKIVAVFRLIESLDMVPVQYFKKLKDYKLWEVRVGWRPGLPIPWVLGQGRPDYPDTRLREEDTEDAG